MTKCRHTLRKIHGYTLVELMAVVAIIGVLAALAVPQYKNYTMQAKAAEAVGVLAHIKARQESYRAEWDEYCNASVNASNWNPTSTPGPTPNAWQPNQDSWGDFRFTPPTPGVLFSYQTVAGRPGVTPASMGFDQNYGIDGAEFWFIARAIADMDGDGTQVRYEIYSNSTAKYISTTSGWE